MDIKAIYNDLPQLETDRLILRKLKKEDVSDIYEYGSNDQVSQYTTWPTHQTLADSQAFVDFVLDRYQIQMLAPWGIEHKETGKLIGTIDFVSWQPNHQTAEIGYALSQAYWGKGLMTEATKEVIRFGFQQMDLVRIQAKCLTKNIGSRRVMEKAGMTYEGTHQKVLKIKGQHWDVHVCAIVK